MWGIAVVLVCVPLCRRCQNSVRATCVALRDFKIGKEKGRRSGQKWRYNEVQNEVVRGEEFLCQRNALY